MAATRDYVDMQNRMYMSGMDEEPHVQMKVFSEGPTRTLNVWYSPEDEWITEHKLYVENYEELNSSPWPVMKAFKGTAKSDFTKNGYAREGSIHLARIIVARILGFPVQVLRPFECIPNDGNYLNCRRENIKFGQWRGCGGDDYFEEYNIGQLRALLTSPN